MKNITIRTRLHSLFIVMMILLLGLGYMGLERMNEFTLAQMKKVEHVNTISSDALLATILFKKQVQEWKNILIRGHNPKDYDKYSEKFEKTRLAVIETVHKVINESNDHSELQKVAKEFLAEHAKLTEQYYAAIPLLLTRKDGLGYRDVDIKVRGIDRPPTTLMESIKEMSETVKIATALEAQQETITFKQELLINASLFFILLTALYILVIETSVLKPIKHLSDVVKKISEGDFAARASMQSQDEIGLLAQSFDALLDERLATQMKLEEESTQLNASIITLLKSVSVLSQKDLRVKIPVSEDITGAVADAINQLAFETANTLAQVNNVSLRVNNASEKVKDQSIAVIELAKQERQETENIVAELKGAVQSMLEVARFTELTNDSANIAMATTDTALDAVNDTVQSINKIREIIREIEKRIKRLGDRSQEISGAISLINDIAERTHILALNAGMQAAQAGDAGRGFMVVANEVQRLAESSREATAEISGLVRNIQVDTSDTINTMNTVITQVVEGTELAELAGERMKASQNVTNELVGSVNEITQRTKAQLTVGNQLQNRAEIIKETTDKTHLRLNEQFELANALVLDAAELVASVQVFKLPS
ncbi:MAG: HAMP domain-containing protein [Methylococcaceae bacterium]|nr:HAMP domain-containing protein [Methylococcaceae bacterium]